MTADPVGQVRAICLALPEVTERLSHGAPTWFVRGKSAFVTAWAGTEPSGSQRDERSGYGDGVEEIDRKIVSLLSGDGRMSFTELARQTGLSVSAAQQRVRRLERRGVITGYAAQVNADDVGLPLTAFVSIKPFDPAAPDDAPQRLAHLPAIEACHSVAGEENYILKVRVASPTALEDLLQEIRAAANVSTRTTIVLSTPYENRPPRI